MAFLDKNIVECLSAKVTDIGRKRISEGNFNISYFKVADSEYDYNFNMLDEMVMTPVELTCDVKYPILLDNVTKLDYAPVVADHTTITVTENVVCDPAKPWKMNIVWTEKPAGLDDTYENLSGYGSNAYASAKEYFGYTSISGQTDNTTASYYNSVAEEVIVSPTQQKCVALVHYSGENYDEYDDWLAYDDDAISYFELTLSNISYHRSGNTTVGYTFKMSTEGGYVKSAVNNSPCLGEKYQYLIDDNGYNVGKIFVGKRVIVIDDQEICAALSTNSNRTWTLPAPKLNYIPSDIPCSPDSGSTCILSGITKDIWITYTFNDGSMHCNYYTKLEGISGEANVSVKFGDEFQYLGLDYSPTELHILAQVVNHGDLPASDGWMDINITSQLPSYTGGTITSSNIVGYQFILTKAMYDAGTIYELSTYIGTQPLQNGGAGDPQFGDETILTGEVKATRATNIHQMNFLVNLPDSQFNISQNPTYTSGNIMLTDIGLYNDNMEMLVTAKASIPHERTGFQQFAVQIDF